MGIPADKSATLLMFIGVFATLGRLGGGFLCNLKLFQARILLQASILIMGTSVMLLSVVKTWYIGSVCHCVQCVEWNDDGNFSCGMHEFSGGF